MHEWLAAQPKTFFSEGIQKLLESWNKCIAKHGEYIEKLYNCKVSANVEINYNNCVRILIDLPSYSGVQSRQYTQRNNYTSNYMGLYFRQYRSADKYLALTGRKNLMFLSECLNFLRRLALQEKEKKPDDSSRLDVVEIARVPDVLLSLFPPWSG